MSVISLVLLGVVLVFLIIAVITDFMVLSDIFGNQDNGAMIGGTVLFIFVISLYIADLILSVSIPSF